MARVTSAHRWRRTRQRPQKARGKSAFVTTSRPRTTICHLKRRGDALWCKLERRVRKNQVLCCCSAEFPPKQGQFGAFQGTAMLCLWPFRDRPASEEFAS
jgi:hypothetical protein